MRKDNPFKEHLDTSVEQISEWKKQNQSYVLGYLCSYVPEEIIHAAGVLPYRIFGDSSCATRADQHLQAYSCSLVKNSLGAALEGKLDFLDGAVFPHTCDTIQRLSDIWRLNAGMNFHFDVVHPVKLTTEGSRTYMQGVLERFRAELGSAVGKEITDAMLSESIKHYNKLRGMLFELYQIRRDNPHLLSSEDIYYALRAAVTMDRTHFVQLLEKFNAELQREASACSSSSNESTEVIITGGICDHPNLYEIIETQGAHVVWDDLCAGYRFFTGRLDENLPPMEAITNRYFERMECPAKHRGTESRFNNLKDLVDKHHASGVIILQLKFCDPHSFDYPYLKEYLDNENIPSILLELEDADQNLGPVRTRLETFIEIINGY